MAGITLSQAETQLAAYLSASEAIATGQEYRIGDRMLKRADLQYVMQMLTYWDSQCKRLSRSGLRIIGGTPV